MIPKLDDLETWIRDCVAHLRDIHGYDVTRAHENEFYLLFGVIVRTMRYADAFLDLMESRKEPEAVPLARAALEHAITLQWVFVSDGGINRFSREVAHDRISHYTNLATWLGNTELAGVVAQLDAPPEGKRLAPFGNLLADLDQEKFLATSYHILSQQVHVTHAGVAAALVQGPEELHITYEQTYPYRTEATYAVAAACMLARWVLAKLTNDEVLLERLDKVSDELHLPMTLVESLPKKKRRRGLS
ncbi:MAG: hypothetical protein JSS74_11195 [Actinobacteria bacterium]|nr:hypothetical protein [Actinomycetota bacterium]